MKVITGDRGTGKTVRLIQESAKTGAYIVVAHERLAEWTAEKAREMRLKIPYPMTFIEFLGSGSYGRGKNFRVLIDDVNLLLRYLARNVPIDTITVSVDEDKYWHIYNTKYK